MPRIQFRRFPHHRWDQLGRAQSLIEPAGGLIAAEYFDIGQTRALPWKRRPHAPDLLTTLADPRRGFDAVVMTALAGR